MSTNTWAVVVVVAWLAGLGGFMFGMKTGWDRGSAEAFAAAAEGQRQYVAAEGCPPLCVRKPRAQTQEEKPD